MKKEIGAGLTPKCSQMTPKSEQVSQARPGYAHFVWPTMVPGSPKHVVHPFVHHVITRMIYSEICDVWDAASSFALFQDKITFNKAIGSSTQKPTEA